MIVYRLCKRKFGNDLSGKGAEKSGGRWNSKGVAMIYTCESRALATAEIAVHIPLGTLPADYELLTIEFPNKIKILTIKPTILPDDWKTFPHPDATQRIGDKFVLGNKFLVMQVPSAVVDGDFNFLINPQHNEINKVKIVKREPFEFDKRLFRK
ncbi:MAG: RES family NAD+ phosphorylase [Bacteroidia bacterium]